MNKYRINIQTQLQMIDNVAPQLLVNKQQVCHINFKGVNKSKVCLQFVSSAS